MPYPQMLGAVVAVVCAASLANAQEKSRTPVQWRRYLQELRPLLNTERAEELAEQLRAVDDPNLAKAVLGFITKEADPEVRCLYVDVLAKFPSEQSVEALVKQTLIDPDPTVHARALDALVKLPDPTYAVQLYTKELWSDNARTVNASAYCLARLDAVQSVEHLIEAVITEQGVWVYKSRYWWVSDDADPRYGAWGAIRKPVKGKAPSQNPQVVEALKYFTGQDFGYDERAWKKWWKEEGKKQIRYPDREDALKPTPSS